MRRYRKKSIKLTDKSSKATNHKRTKKSMRDDTIDEKDEVITSTKYVNCK